MVVSKNIWYIVLFMLLFSFKTGLPRVLYICAEVYFYFVCRLWTRLYLCWCIFLFWLQIMDEKVQWMQRFHMSVITICSMCLSLNLRYIYFLTWCNFDVVCDKMMDQNLSIYIWAGLHLDLGYCDNWLIRKMDCILMGCLCANGPNANWPT